MELGLNTYKQHEQVDDNATLGRISLNSAGMYKVMHLNGAEINAIPKNRTEQFLVGDWVALEPQADFDLINQRLPRYSTLGRLTGEGLSCSGKRCCQQYRPVIYLYFHE